MVDQVLSESLGLKNNLMKFKEECFLRPWMMGLIMIIFLEEESKELQEMKRSCQGKLRELQRNNNYNKMQTKISFTIS